ncbi:carboxypeptidase-like regulatory domain-containing protein [Bacteroides stercorirosoris]|uniref:CarboxypepD_reg-like domain-containing protein n=1 Tax=Bacteroides stercorirosoris TaxID=871324 RepID=A0A1M6H8W5_9BACE|nr:carboxypeptidase-like regulatory domain-containing protein [Bacteroides stercorirosoris]SHJ18664.1 CarboxypepD_reg-like domain-containing protein [Bacteroides stercorirosoris]
MKKLVGITFGWLMAFLLLDVSPLWAQDEVESYFTVTGIVKNKDNKRKLENVNVSVPGTNIGTVTNADGVFSLKIKDAEVVRGLEVSHIGYLNTQISLKENKDVSDLTIWMLPAPNMLNEIVIFGNNARGLVEEAIKKIPANYAVDKNLLTAFYRETVQKRRRYISVSEAVIDVSKTAYSDREPSNDKVQLQKGRRLLSQKTGDTLAVKVVGGPNLSIYLDIVKNGDALLSIENLNYYDFRIEEPVNLDNRMQYVVSFRPRVSLMYALFYGKIYIDFEKLAFTRAEFSLDMQNRVKAVEAILHKKPLGLRFRPQEVSYLVTYKEKDGRTYLNYIRNEIRFKCDWKKRLFSSSYTAFSEMVVTDRKESNFAAIPSKKAFKEKQVFYDMVDEYWNEDFWKAYNIIEPTESLEHAVSKLKKQSR